MRSFNCIFLWLFVLSFTSCSFETNDDTVQLFYNGEILTMSGPQPEYIESLATSKGKIVFVGDLAAAKKNYAKAELIDLEGRFLMPGLIDAHAHFGGFPAQSVGAKILPPPDAGVSSIDDLIKTFKEWATPENIGLTGWIFGMGFDDSVIKEKRFPTKFELDQVSTEFPVIAIHISGHLAAVNSKALEVLGIDKNTKDPNGGIIRRIKGTNEPNGVLEELAAIPHYQKVLTPLNAKAAKIFFESGQNLALSYGYTTAHEGRAMQGTHDFLAQAAENNTLKIDVVSYVDYTADNLIDSKWFGKDYINNYRIAGIKLTLDGSPQGRTAWRTSPYLLPPPGQNKDYKGYPAIADDNEVEAIFDKAFRNNQQIIVHGNGDAAMDQMIRTLTKVTSKYPKKDRRNVLIHGQYIREDQLDSFKELDIIVSLFPLHTFYWGDWHRQLIGEKLGDKISPTRTALNKGLRLTIHTDAPVALPNLMRMVGISVERKSRSGRIIGESERLTPYEALQGITIWSAYQHFEENDKGSLEVGKLADLVILDKNPLKVHHSKIKDILVLQTIKNGNVVFRR